jgi:hypothetical protein
MSKKLADILDTRDRKEQEDRVARMKFLLEQPVICLTIFYHMGQPTFDILASQEVNSQQIKALLQATIEKVTRLEIEQEKDGVDGDQPNGIGE